MKLALSVVLLVACSLQCLAQSSQRPPNIVVVMSDDQGIGDFGCAGNLVLDTPRLDAFSAQCPKLSRFYVSPVCSPTRASLMTGRYNYRTRVVDTWIGRSMMEPDEVTIAELLRDSGYRTGIFGKWHLGDCYPMRPQDQGFDVSLVHRGGGLAQPSEPPANGRRYTDPILFQNGEQVATKGYCTDVYFDAALGFIDAAIAKGRPFFTYIATNAPHGPFHDVPEDLLEKYRARDLGSVAIGREPNIDRIARVFAMVENIDQNFGRLMDHLDAREVTEDTIVVFLCDNGPIAGRYVDGLRGSKTSVYEGGIRSPLWIRWPGKLSPDVRSDRIAAHIDVLPTLCEMAKVPLPTNRVIDGRSLLPLLAGEPGQWADRYLVLQTHRGDVPVAEHHFAVVGQQYKLLRHSGFGRMNPQAGAPFGLFDLTEDPGEASDIAAEHPLEVARMRQFYRDWFDDVSSTRGDNYAKPRIHVGTEMESRTTLTRQDWVPADGVGWGHEGVWLLHAPRACELRVTLVFRGDQVVEGFRLEAGSLLVERRLEVAKGARVELGTFEFPAGDLDLRITCDHGDGPFAPHQVVLELR
jgi:arylsulfatase A-like enzyme